VSGERAPTVSFERKRLATDHVIRESAARVWEMMRAALEFWAFVLMGHENIVREA
jgi:hypothetical protein